MSRKGRKIKLARILDRFNRRGRNRGQSSIWRMYRRGGDRRALN